jgi:manganese-dependent inorganic pyrophosphatase
MIYVVGHKAPDTDAIVSAIVFAEFLKLKGIEAQAIKLGELNMETKFVLEKFNVYTPETLNTLNAGEKIALVDHNESAQSIDNLEALNIEYIVDHHKFNLKTEKPLNIRAEKIGSTASILYKMFVENNFEISKLNASLLISAIISDTLFFRSPTTTEQDKTIVSKLNEIAQIENLENYSLDLFNAKSDLSELSVDQIIKLDMKKFEISGKKIAVGVMETTNPDFALNLKSEIIERMNEIKSEENFDGLIFCIVDILKEQNTTFAPSEFEANICTELFNADQIDNVTFDLGSLISRKKQIIPKLETLN